MKKLVLVLGLLAALLMVGSAVWAAENVLLDSVDIGAAGDMAYATLEGWGPIEPATHGGNYGGIDDTRCIWDVSDDDPTATLVLHTPKGSARTLVAKHLDGIADDSFNVYVQHSTGRWVMVDSYTDEAPANDPEVWFSRTLNLTSPDLAPGREVTIKLEATGPKWSGFDTYGQVCFDLIELYGNGAPR